jgi:hypothetical protein
LGAAENATTMASRHQEKLVHRVTNSCLSNIIGRGANNVSLKEFHPTARNKAAQIDRRQRHIQ